MKIAPATTKYHYNYKNKCDCADDDNCGCTYPNNMAHNFSPSDDFATETYIKAQIGTKAPNFTAPAILADNTLQEDFNLYNETRERAAVLFFYPEDFSFTCPSELLMLNKEINAFQRREAIVIGISTDSIGSHYTWKELPPEKDGISDLMFPLVSDLEKSISQSYGVLNKKQTAMRATVIIDKNRIIRHISLNDNKIWRSPEETLRILDIINATTDDMTSCPLGWKQNFFFERPEQETLAEMFAHRSEC